MIIFQGSLTLAQPEKILDNIKKGSGAINVKEAFACKLTGLPVLVHLHEAEFEQFHPLFLSDWLLCFKMDGGGGGFAKTMQFAFIKIEISIRESL